MSKINIHCTAYDLVREIVNHGADDYFETFDLLTSDNHPTDEELVVIVVRRRKPKSRSNVFGIAPDSASSN